MRPDGNFDIVTCQNASDHINYPDKAIRELNRILSTDFIVGSIKHSVVGLGPDGRLIRSERIGAGAASGHVRSSRYLGIDHVPKQAQSARYQNRLVVSDSTVIPKTKVNRATP